MKLSAVISAYNEEKKIEDCLRSLKDVVDEIVVVDNSSTDDTAQTAKRFTDKVYTQKNDPTSIDTQKNFGFEKATGDWILSLDADERVTPELAKEIREKIQDSRFKIQEENEVVGYWIPRKNMLFGKWIQHTGWYPDEQLRLFQKGKGIYKEKHVHEHLVVDGATKSLKNPLIHLNYESILQFITRAATVYTPNEADNIIDNGYVFNYLDAIRMPVREFINRFFAREGYKDGVHGLMLSMLMAWYHFMIFAYIWEKKKYVEDEHIFSLKHIHHEGEKLGKEIVYWFDNEEIKQTTNPVKKVLLKTKRRLNK